MNLEKKLLPDCISADGELWRIKTDFRYGLMFMRFVKERRAITEYAVFFDGAVPRITRPVADALIDFYTDEPPLPRGGSGDNGVILTDWNIDADLIYAAFYEQYGIDLFDVNLHWHKFLALFRSLHNTRLNEVIQIRAWKPSDNTKYDAHMRQMQASWRIERKVDETDEAYQKFVSKLKPAGQTKPAQPAAQSQTEQVEQAKP